MRHFAQAGVGVNAQRRLHVAKALHERDHLEAQLAGGSVERFDLRMAVGRLAAEATVDCPAERVLPFDEHGVVTHRRDDVQQLEAAGVDAMLVGEHLIASDDIGQAVRRLLGKYDMKL